MRLPKCRFLPMAAFVCALVFIVFPKRPVIPEEEQVTEEEHNDALVLQADKSVIGANHGKDTSRTEGRNIAPRIEGFKETGIHIAVGGGIISKGVAGLTPATLDKLDFFNTFLPSFCETITSKYHYHLYWGYDFNDPFFADKLNQTAFARHTDTIVRKKCPSGIKVPVVFVRCDYTGFPAWAQNDAMFAAYLDGADYFYRINDDSKLVTKEWAEAFVGNLEKRDPPNVGVVGPLSQHDYAPILSYDFVHKTHVDMLGIYYPRIFHKWFADSWISDFYRAEGKYVKLENVTLVHTKTSGRYQPDKSESHLKGVALWCYKHILKRFRSQIGNGTLATGTSPANGNKQVISMSLFGDKLKYTTGAIRNAQLAPVLFKGWTTRFYVPPKSSTLSVPENVISKLLELGAEVITVTDSRLLQPRNWRYLVLTDENVDAFLIRDVDFRLSDREKEAVNLWLSVKDPSPVHVIKDLPQHVNARIPAGMWGALRKPLSSIMRNVSSTGGGVSSMLGRASAAEVDEFIHAAAVSRKHVTCAALDKAVSGDTCRLVNLKTRVRTPCGDVRVGQRYEAFDLPRDTENAHAPKTK